MALDVGWNIVYDTLRHLLSTRNVFVILLICFLGFIDAQPETDIDNNFIEKQRYDGWYNNLGHLHWGSAESHLTRKAPPSYADGVYMLAGQNRPSPRYLSEQFMAGTDGMASKVNRTALLVFFGQLVSSEILQASEPGCPIELHKIEIERCDKIFDKDCRGNRYMPFLRASWDYSTGQSPNNPREQASCQC